MFLYEYAVLYKSNIQKYVSDLTVGKKKRTYWIPTLPVKSAACPAVVQLGNFLEALF